LIEDRDSDQSDVWTALYSRIQETLRPHGAENGFGRGDYYVLDENWGVLAHQIEFQNLSLLRPAIVKSLQSLLVSFPNWQISVRVDPGEHRDWPHMGLTIEADVIFDGLKREYLPPEVRDFRYEGSRPPLGLFEKRR
jgi:hypothetical protein